MKRTSEHLCCVLYGLLFSTFYICISYNLGFLWTPKHSIECGIKKNEDLIPPQRSNVLHNANKETNKKYRNPYDETDSEALSFYNDLELIKMIGEGDVSYAFEARYKNQTVVAKIAADGELYFSDIEIDFFRELNAPPSISNIPKLYYAVRSMPNPFFAGNQTYLKKDLKIPSNSARRLTKKRRISVLVIDLLENRVDPKGLDDVRRLMKSMLETMQFVHSRNIMHCDLHGNNYFWDGNKVSFFDWNAAFKYEPNRVPIHYDRAPDQLFPPEAEHNTSSVHTSVYAFDVYTIGRLLKMLLEKNCGVTLKKLRKSLKKLDTSNKSEEARSRLLDSALAYELAEYMMIPDPYKRPDTAAALMHPFFEKLTAEEQISR